MRRVYLILVPILLFFLTYSCTGGEDGSVQSAPKKANAQIDGKALFLKQCTVCHGEDGRKGMAGAKILPESKLTREQRVQMVLNGKGNMMPYKGVLTMQEIEALVDYTFTLK